MLVIHGSVGNYLTGVPRRISFGLASAGFTVLSANTRMANYGVIFGGGLMHRTPLDIDAALALLRRRGFKRIVLLGFSMGATMVTHYQALRRPADVVGVCTLAHPLRCPARCGCAGTTSAPTPATTRWPSWCTTAWRPTSRRATATASSSCGGPAASARGPLDGEVYTYRTWWSSRGPRAPHAESRLRIGDVTVPLAIVQAGEDELVREERGLRARDPGAPGRLPERDARDDPRRRPRVRRLRRAPLVESVVEWLDARTLDE